MVDRKASVENESTTANNNNNIAAIKGDTSAAATSTVSETSPSGIIELEIQDIEGIGPTTAKKLKEAGIVSPMDLAVASAEELAADINISKESAATFVIAAHKLLREFKVIEKEFVSADVALEKRKSML